MVTRRRSSTSRTTRSGSSRATGSRTTRSGRSRTTRRTRSSTTRRRRPRVATTLGSAVALALVAAWLRLAWWPWRIMIIAAVVVLATVWFLWSRRGDIYDEMHADRPEADPAEAGPAGR